jgi:hypothetical protein
MPFIDDSRVLLASLRVGAIELSEHDFQLLNEPILDLVLNKYIVRGYTGLPTVREFPLDNS